MGRKILAGLAIIAIANFLLALFAPDVYNAIVNGISDFFAWIGRKTDQTTP